jgi:hypothetical protein
MGKEIAGRIPVGEGLAPPALTEDASTESKTNQTKDLGVLGDPLEVAQFALCKRKFLESFVERQVFIGVILPKRFVSFFAFPEVASYKGAVTKWIAQKESSLVRGITPEQLSPIAGRPIYAFKPFVTSWLDIELPED